MPYRNSSSRISLDFRHEINGSSCVAFEGNCGACRQYWARQSVVSCYVRPSFTCGLASGTFPCGDSPFSPAVLSALSGFWLFLLAFALLRRKRVAWLLTMAFLPVLVRHGRTPYPSPKVASLVGFRPVHTRLRHGWFLPFGSSLWGEA